ncbi:MAG: hypothetical protein AB1810_09185 [Pseudomonadota bacterium]
MEVFVAILLLFGAFSLGAASRDGVDEEPAAAQTSDASGERANVPETVQDAKNVGDRRSYGCAADRHYVIYRDLTRAPDHAGDRQTAYGGDCEGSCQDE